jgi:hypothetical protein
MPTKQTGSNRTPPEELEPPHGPGCSLLSSSLDAQETSPHPFDEEGASLNDPLALQSTQQRIAHRHHARIRERIIRSLHGAGDEQLRKRAHRLAACCCCPTFRTSPDTRIGVSLSRCRDRMCPLCSRRRGSQATAKVAAITHTFDAPRLLTLTLRSNNDGLEKCVRRLFSCFGELRSLKGWTTRVHGGIWTLEVTRNAQTAQWHAHLHLICDGDFFPQPLLKTLWHQVTGDSFIVDVRAVHDRAEAARYVAAYLSKPLDAASWPPEAIAEYAAALHGKRLMQPFGTARSVSLDEDAPDHDPAKSLPLCHAHCLQQACSAGYEPARTARDIVARLSPDHSIAASVVPPAAKGALPPVEPWELEIAFATLERLQKHWPELPPDAFPPPPEPERAPVQAMLHGSG